MKKLAIIGFGPRGLHALEMLFLELSKLKIDKIEVFIFETETSLGAGQVWKTNQPSVNWTNISVRALQNLEGRPEIQFKDFVIPEFPSYHNYLPEEKRKALKDLPDQFPPRKEIGAYLNDRATSILNVLEEKECVNIHRKFVTDVNFKDSGFIITDSTKHTYVVNEVLLTIGHQSTKLPKDLKHLEIESLESDKTLFSETYPIENIIESEEINAAKHIAIRGFGLAMIDAVRALTIEKGGEFRITNHKTFASEFKTSNNVVQKIIPYSLDGLPMVPKPLDKIVDEQFMPKKVQLKQFENTVSKYAKGDKKANNANFLKEIFAKIGVEIYLELENKLDSEDSAKKLEKAILNWFDDNTYKHETLVDAEIDTKTLIATYVNMAVNEVPISLDFCVGQVIRHLQPTLYKTFSHANVSDAIFADVIQFDEQMKRYSYGPPMESMQQLIALNTAGILDFSFVNNPKISTNDTFWRFEKNKNKIDCEVIINSVLSAPKLLEVTTPVILNLLKNDLIQPIHSKLGIETNADATIVLDDASQTIPLAVLGRLAKGSVIGVDAILECFGPRIKDWAKGFVSRL